MFSSPEPSEFLLPPAPPPYPLLPFFLPLPPFLLMLLLPLLTSLPLPLLIFLTLCSQIGFELQILLPHLPQCWEQKHAHLASLEQICLLLLVSTTVGT